MSRTKNALLIIDAQNDFCIPGAPLYVQGADKDNDRLAAWIMNNASEIDHISYTLDTHQINDVSHPSIWRDKNGNVVAPHTPISYQDLLDGKYYPVIFRQKIQEYIRKIEEIANEEVKNNIPFPILSHYIWPEHCIMGTSGAELDKKISDAIIHWARQNPAYFYEAWVKGTNPLTEHFGAFRAQVTYTEYPETQLNQNLVSKLEKYDNVFFAGQAKSHCVATTLKQALFEAPGLASKFVILEDTMSDVVVPGIDFGAIAQPIYDLAKQKGIRFTTTKDAILTPAMAI